MVPMIVQNQHVAALVDTGSQVTIMNEKLFDALPDRPGSTGKAQLRMAGDQLSPAKIVRQMKISIGDQHFRWDVYVAPVFDSFILGIDFMRRFGIKLDLKNGLFTIKGQKMNLEMEPSRKEGERTSSVRLERRTVIPPNTGRDVKVLTSLNDGQEYMISPAADTGGVMIANTLVYGQPEVYVRILNCTNRYVKLPGEHILGVAEPVEHDVRRTPDGDANIYSTSRINVGEGIAKTNTTEKPPEKELRDQGQITNVMKGSGGEGTDGTQLPGHLIDLFNRSIEHISPTEQVEVRKLLMEYQDIFSKGPTDLGCFREITHRIDLYQDARPVRQALRRVPLGFEGEEEANLKTLLKTGVIQESNSEWASAPVLIRKRDGSVRYCIDFRVLNSLTVKDAFGIPSISQCLDQLEGCTMYSCLDLASGYHQIMVAEEDRHKTAFVTKYGLYEHRRMAFGLCNAPATFMRVMALVLRGLTWNQILAYLDDVIVLGKGFTDQIVNLRTTFDRFRQYNLKLKPKKCSLFRREVTFLGKLVSAAGISVNPENVDKVKKWPVPNCAKDVERFLGFVNYHREHIKEYAHTAQCLYKLTQKKAIFEWNQEQQASFDRLIESLVSAPILVYPNAHDRFILDADASNECIGAELIQIQDGAERVVSYGSFVLTPEQRKYCTTRKELLAVVRFTRQFRHYLLGRKFLIRTDHNSLTWLLRFKNANGQLARWLEELSQFDMSIIHRKGSLHTNADGLSRRPDVLDYCDCYRAGVSVSQLPCAVDNCRFCQRGTSRMEEI